MEKNCHNFKKFGRRGKRSKVDINVLGEENIEIILMFEPDQIFNLNRITNRHIYLAINADPSIFRRNYLYSICNEYNTEIACYRDNENFDYIRKDLFKEFERLFDMMLEYSPQSMKKYYISTKRQIKAIKLDVNNFEYIKSPSNKCKMMYELLKVK